MSSIGHVVSLKDKDKDYSGFRFGQDYSVDEAVVMCDRSGYAKFIVRELVEEAIKTGFELVKVDKDEEKLVKSDQIWKFFEKFWHKVIDSFEYQRKTGRSLIVIFQKSKATDPYLKVYSEDLIMDDKLSFSHDEKLEKCGVIDYSLVDGETKDTNYYFPHETNTIDDKPVNKIDAVYYHIEETKERFWLGRSKIEPVWDCLQGLEIIEMGLVLYAIRVGGGLRIIAVPQGLSEDEFDKLKESAKRMDSINGYFLVPEGVDVTIETSSGNVNYQLLKQALIEHLSAYLKVPQARMKGIEPGQREGADTNEQSYFDVLRDIQNQAEKIVKWLIEQFNKPQAWGLVEDQYKIKWNIRNELTEKDQAELDAMKAERVSMLFTSNIISQATAQELLDMPIEEVEPPALMMSGFGNQNQDDNQDGNIETKTETKTKKEDDE